MLHNATCDIAPICPRHNLPTLHRIHAEALSCAAHYTLGYHWHCLPTSPKCPARVPGLVPAYHCTSLVPYTTHPTAHIRCRSLSAYVTFLPTLRCTSFVPFDPLTYCGHHHCTCDFSNNDHATAAAALDRPRQGIILQGGRQALLIVIQRRIHHDVFECICTVPTQPEHKPQYPPALLTWS